MNQKVVLFSAVMGLVLVMMAVSPSHGELIDTRTGQLREGTEAVCDGVGDEGARATVVAYQGQRYTVCQYIPYSRDPSPGNVLTGHCRIYGEDGRYGFEVRCLSDRNTCPPVNGSRTDPYGDHACLLAAYPADIREHVIMAARFSDDDPVVAEDPEAVTTLAIARARRW